MSFIRLAFPALLTLLPGLAMADVQHCRISVNAGDSAPIAPDIFVERNDADVLVFDGYIKHFNNDQPMPATIATDNEARTTYTWSLKVHDGISTPAQIQYRLTIFKADGRAQITSKVKGYTNNSTNQGKCAPAK